MNYVTSHDDGYPFDKNREKSIVAGTKLLLTPAIAQVYYGDESARALDIKGTEGDATLRSFMNWDDIKSNEKTKKVLSHYQKIGQFRATHPAIGAGIHQEISKAPFYTFSRMFTKGEYTDQVIVGLDLPIGKKTINVKSVFEEGEELIDTYSDSKVTVKAGEVIIDSPFDIVLLERR